jgi:lipoprotein signal peptidase
MAVDATSLLSSQLGGAAACAYLLNLLQKWSKTPWITEHTAGINRVVRAALALATTVGIGWAWSSTADNSHILMITIPPALSIMHGVWHWFTQYAFTHWIGAALEAKSGPPTTQ